MRTGKSAHTTTGRIPTVSVCGQVPFPEPVIDALVSSWLARTDPKDVARVESKTVIVTKNHRDTVPIPAGGAKSQLGSWMSESDWQRAREERFPGCMTGRLEHLWRNVFLWPLEIRPESWNLSHASLGHRSPKKLS